MESDLSGKSEKMGMRGEREDDDGDDERGMISRRTD